MNLEVRSSTPEKVRKPLFEPRKVQDRKMSIEGPELEPRWLGKRPRVTRTPIGNGTKLIMADGRGTWAKRYREICAAHCSDLGGFENLSQAELAIIKRAATLQVELEAQEATLANGEAPKGFSLVEFAQVSNGLRRLLETVGIKRVCRDISVSIDDLVAKHRAEDSTP
jgi:hypothetical protein